MELRHLRYFIAVAEELNFTKAAEKLCIVQPSLSKQIRDLEDEIGVILFERDKRSVHLTIAGSGFLEHAYQTIESAERAIATAKQIILSSNKHTKIGFNPLAEILVAPHIVVMLRNNGYQAELKSMSCSDQIHDLKNSKLDLTFTRYKLEDPEYENILIKNEPLYLFYRENYKDLDDSVNIHTLENSQFITFSAHDAPVLAEKTLSFLKQKNIKPQHKIMCSNIMQHINFLNTLNCWSIIPEYTISFLKGKYNVKKLELSAPLYANYRKRSNNSSLNLILPLLQKLKNSV
jgi:LysR family hca operon transcriptional activator